MKKTLDKLLSIAGLNNNQTTKHRNNNTAAYKAFSAIDFPFQSDSDFQHSSPSEYSKNIIVHRCVNLISQSASHVPWRVYIKKGSNWDRSDIHPSNSLLKKPNPELAGADFIARIISHLLLYGNSYVALSSLNRNDISGLYVLNPESVEIKFQKNIPVAYKISDSSSSEERLFAIDKISRQSKLLHLKSFNPASIHYGISSLAAASRSINLHHKTLEWNMSLLRNSSRPSGALVFQDGNGYLSDEQFERLKEQFYSNFSGSMNSGKPLILEGGLKWQDTNSAEKFEKFLELKDSLARDIAIAFNIPPQLLGINGDNTYSNMREARLALWEENIIPLLDKLSDSFSNWFSYWYGHDLLIDFDRDSISSLTEKRENLWSKIADANFMTINEKRSLVGFGPISGGDNLFSESLSYSDRDQDETQY